MGWVVYVLRVRGVYLLRVRGVAKVSGRRAREIIDVCRASGRMFKKVGDGYWSIKVRGEGVLVEDGGGPV